MVAVWACSVLFMSCHDSSASGRSRLSTVCTTAWHGQRGKAFITAVTGNILQQGAKNPEQLAGNEEQTNQATN